MKVDIKQPKYVLPVILLPFFCLFFYVWRSGEAKNGTPPTQRTGLNAAVGEVSTTIRQKQLADKLDAYRNTYKQADGQSVVGALPDEFTMGDPARGVGDSLPGPEVTTPQATPGSTGTYTDNLNDLQLSKAIAQLKASAERPRAPDPPPHEKDTQNDPMEVFKQQMRYLDSMEKSKDPAIKEAQQQADLKAKMEKLKAAERSLPLTSSVTDDHVLFGQASDEFNTIAPRPEASFISAVIDEPITGYAGSRIRLRLLDRIRSGREMIERGTLLYGVITGFNAQRVEIKITSILSQGKILPVRLTLYDLDGLPGLYVPSSAFREFTRDLGSSSVQGVNIEGGGSDQFLMSTASKFFRSSSSAIADLLRKNKAHLKFNSHVYLIDPESLPKPTNND